MTQSLVATATRESIFSVAKSARISGTALLSPKRPPASYSDLQYKLPLFKGQCPVTGAVFLLALGDVKAEMEATAEESRRDSSATISVQLDFVEARTVIGMPITIIAQITSQYLFVV